jgi:hypothetical protein
MKGRGKKADVAPNAPVAILSLNDLNTVKKQQ